LVSFLRLQVHLFHLSSRLFIFVNFFPSHRFTAPGFRGSYVVSQVAYPD
jgi:hypothetical protein